MIDGPSRAPSSPPETPVPTKRKPFASSAFVRRIESGKCELPPSMTMSPGDRCGRSCSMRSSTGLPALTISMTRRGRFSEATSSGIERVPTIFFPLPRPEVKASTLSTVRLKTATVKPRLSMLRTRFSPMTARPTRPMSAIPRFRWSRPFLLCLSRRAAGRVAPAGARAPTGRAASRTGRRRHSR